LIIQKAWVTLEEDERSSRTNQKN